MEEASEDASVDFEALSQDIASGESSRVQAALEVLSYPETFYALSADLTPISSGPEAPARSYRASILSSVLTFCRLNTIPDAFFQTWLCGSKGLMLTEPREALIVFISMFTDPDRSKRALAEKYLLTHEFNGAAAWDLQKRYFLEVLDIENKQLAEELRKPRNGQPSPFL